MTRNDTDDAARIVSLLEGIGYPAERLEDNRIKVRSGGVFATIVLYADASLSLRCRVSVGDEIILDVAKVNEANHNLRFSKFSVDDDALLMESDFVFDPAADAAEEGLRKIMAIWDASLGKLKSLVMSLQAA